VRARRKKGKNASVFKARIKRGQAVNIKKRGEVDDDQLGRFTEIVHFQLASLPEKKKRRNVIGAEHLGERGLKALP